MNISQLSALTRLPMRLWRRLNHWRAMRLYAQVERMPERAAELTAKADRLIGKNVRSPMPLFDRNNENH